MKKDPLVLTVELGLKNVQFDLKYEEFDLKMWNQI